MMGTSSSSCRSTHLVSKAGGVQPFFIDIFALLA